VQRAGLKIYPRRPYAAGATSSFDYPLSSRFDEIDSLIVLDDVFGAWENVVLLPHLQLCRDQWWRTPSHSYGNHQRKSATPSNCASFWGSPKTVRDTRRRCHGPPVQIMLGEKAALCHHRGPHDPGPGIAGTH